MNKNLLLTAVVSVAIGVFIGIFFQKSIGHSGNAAVSTHPGLKMATSNMNFAEFAMNALDLPSAVGRTANGELIPVYFGLIDTTFIAVGFGDSIRSTGGPLPCCPRNPLCCRKVIDEDDGTKVKYEDLSKIVFSYDYSRVGQGELEVLMLSENGEVLGSSRSAGNTLDDTATKTFYATAGKPATRYTGNATLLLRYTSRAKVLFSRTIDLDVK